MAKLLAWLAAGIALVVVAMVAVGAVVVQRLGPVAADGSAQAFVVDRGASLGRVAADLERAGLVRDARAVVAWTRWRGLAESLQAGEYELSPAMSAGEIVDAIATGRVRSYEIVIPEGTRALEIAARLESEGLASSDEFLAAVADAALIRELGVEGDSLEGYLFPETYRIPKDLPAEQIARGMVEQFQRAWREVEDGAAESGLSMREVVTLASIVEKETGAAHERPLIAAVFLNRLEKGMRLETDPTVIYGIADFDGNLKRVHLRDGTNPYNTYKHAGLPPGPIANPGLDALRAVVSPAESDYLYFVSMNDGTHKFSRTYREHVNAVNRYQRGGRAANRRSSP